MTALGRYQGMDTVLARLEAVRARYMLVGIVRSAAAAVTVVVGSLVIFALAGYWPGQPPAALRWTMLIAALAAWVAAVVWLALNALRSRLNHAQTARLIEQHLDGLDNALINAIQLSADRMQVSAPLVASAIRETSRRTGKLPLAGAVSTRSMRRWSISAAAAVVVFAALALLQGGPVSRGLAAVFNPGGYVRHLGTIKLLALEPEGGDTTMFAGETLTITATIDNPTRRRWEARVEIAGAAQRAAIASPDGARYTCRLGKVEQSFKYAIRIGDSRFPADRPYYTVTVHQPVEVERFDLHYTYPRYIARKERVVTNAGGYIEAPLGTAVTATLGLSAPVPGAKLVMRDGKSLPMRGDGGKTFSGTIDVAGDGAYRIVLADKSGRSLKRLPDPGDGIPDVPELSGWYRIRAVPDLPPKIGFVEPTRNVSAAPGTKLTTRLRVSDDHGLEAVRFFLGLEGQPARVVNDFADVKGMTSAELVHVIEVGGHYREGDVLVFHATATDGRYLGRLGGPQTASTAKIKITVEDAAKVAAARAKRYEQLRARLLKILAAQEAQRVNSEIAARKDRDLLSVRTTGNVIAVGQQAIRLDILDAVDHFPFEPEMITIQQALALLGNNASAVAVTQARLLAGLDDMGGRDKACQALSETQDKIIRALQTLLAILPSIKDPEAASRTAAGADMPPEAREKLADLKAALEKFIDEEKKIIQASQRLAKRPVDDFNPEDQKLLKELELAQDKWEKFLNEAFADFSKLAQQDFSKPSMLKELISVKTDVTMAKDALKKKAVEIATAIEDNGIENAETLTANIEKWLPDEPDRIKWDMEDPAGQTNVEQPELPKELEDLVGDLLEEEEDLFEEMDDITAKYTMSGDKGIGWDAMDGPISNMNAQGVTGNQLPNTSEISGRSGEGRQGKSLGEFVEDKAVGKGGRRTPTRLTPEPFQQGQVNDTSAEPAGGATGGGKLSGAGSEGLEGPLPKELQDQLKRLAGKHAQIRNKAERIQAQFKVSDYSNYQFLQAVTLMNRVQRDLVNYRYVNALRQRRVTLSALRRTHELLTGKIDVTTDATADRPKYVREDVADAMRAKVPAEYRLVLEEYFRRLAEMEK